VFSGFFVLTMSYVIFGFDLYPQLDIKSTIEDLHPSTWTVIGGVIVFIIGAVVLAIFALHNFYVVGRRLIDRQYLLAGGPLTSVEGKPDFDTATRSRINQFRSESLFHG
jgi:hypothetical protein